MVLKTRVIPCLDIDAGRVVKGVKFQELSDVGSPVELAKYYSNNGADELCLLDVTASYAERNIMIDIVKDVARECNIPFAVGGGIRSLEDASRVIDAGADKVVIGTAATSNPKLISEVASVFGSQCVVVSTDVALVDKSIAEQKSPNLSGYNIFTHGGRNDTKIDAMKFLEIVSKMGAGEILLNSIDADGGKSGFNLDLTSRITSASSIPVIASGGAGTVQHFVDVAKDCKVSAVLAASVFHFQEFTITDVKQKMAEAGLNVRLSY